VTESFWAPIIIDRKARRYCISSDAFLLLYQKLYQTAFFQIYLSVGFNATTGEHFEGVYINTASARSRYQLTTEPLPSLQVPGRPQQQYCANGQRNIGHQCGPGKIGNKLIVNAKDLPAPQIFPEPNLHFPVLRVERSQLPVGGISKLGEFFWIPAAEHPEKQAA
jgi:hypothetical protein